MILLGRHCGRHPSDGLFYVIAIVFNSLYLIRKIKLHIIMHTASVKHGWSPSPCYFYWLRINSILFCFLFFVLNSRDTLISNASNLDDSKNWISWRDKTSSCLFWDFPKLLLFLFWLVSLFFNVELSWK